MGLHRGPYGIRCIFNQHGPIVGVLTASDVPIKWWAHNRGPYGKRFILYHRGKSSFGAQVLL